MSFGRRTWDKEEYAQKAALRKDNRYNKEREAVKKSTLSRDTLSFDKDLNKRQIITGSVQNTRGKSFGFYCDICNLTFKDNLKFVDHLNSKPHLIQSGEFRQGRREVTLEEVKTRYDRLCRELDGKLEPEVEEETNKKRKKRETIQEVSTEENEVAKLMGFSGFASSKR